MAKPTPMAARPPTSQMPCGVAEHSDVVQDDHERADSHQTEHNPHVQRRRVGFDLLLRRCSMVRRVLLPASFGSCHGRHITAFSTSEPAVRPRTIRMIRGTGWTFIWLGRLSDGLCCLPVVVHQPADGPRPVRSGRRTGRPLTRKSWSKKSNTCPVVVPGATTTTVPDAGPIPDPVPKILLVEVRQRGR